MQLAPHMTLLSLQHHDQLEICQTSTLNLVAATENFQESED